MIVRKKEVQSQLERFGFDFRRGAPSVEEFESGLERQSIIYRITLAINRLERFSDFKEISDLLTELRTSNIRRGPRGRIRWALYLYGKELLEKDFRSKFIWTFPAIEVIMQIYGEPNPPERIANRIERLTKGKVTKGSYMALYQQRNPIIHGWEKGRSRFGLNKDSLHEIEEIVEQTIISIAKAVQEGKIELEKDYQILLCDLDK